MRICILGRSQYPLLRRRAQSFAALGHEVHVLSLETAPEGEGFKVHRIPSRVGGPARYIWALPAMLRALRALAPDVIDIHGLSTYGLYGLFPLGAPTVATVYGPDVYGAQTRSAVLR